MKSSRSSLLLMMLPVLGIAIFALAQQQKLPSPPAKPQTRINIEVVREKIYPLDVWAGCDTKFTIRYSKVGPWPMGWWFSGVEWLKCIRLVACKNGRERTLFPTLGHHDYTRWPDSHGGEFGEYGGQGHFRFALREVPREWGEIWLRLDYGLQSANSIREQVLDPSTVAKLKMQGRATWVSKSLCLRRDGEMIKLPRISKRPRLELRDWHIENQAQTPNGADDRQLVLHILDHGPLPKPDVNGEIHDLQAHRKWEVVDERGSRCIQAIEYTPGFYLMNLVKGTRIYEVRFIFWSKTAPKARRLRVQGPLSCDNRWPMMINLPLLDRTAKTSRKQMRSN